MAELVLELLEQAFSVCKLDELPEGLLERPFTFVARTDAELSVACETRVLAEVPERAVLEREDGWRALRVVGQLDFGLVGILAALSSALAEAGVPLFAVSTFDTDYVLVKGENLARALDALREAGCAVEGLAAPAAPAVPAVSTVPDAPADAREERAFIQMPQLSDRCGGSRDDAILVPVPEGMDLPDSVTIVQGGDAPARR